MKTHKKTKSYALYTLLAVVLLVSCTDSDTANTMGLMEWVKLPITEMTIGQLLFFMLAIGFITKGQYYCQRIADKRSKTDIK